MKTYHLEFDIAFKTHDYPGKFVAIEGIDGSGKTIHVEKLKETLKGTYPLFITKNPTDEPTGEFIRRVLSGEVKIPPVAIQYLFSADRQVQQVEIIEHLKKGDLVISDRYFWSALAYGVVDRLQEDANDSLSQLLVAQGILSHYHQFIVPDMTIYLDVSTQVAIKRLSHMEKSKEIYETQEKLERIKKAYELIMEKFPDEFTKINSDRDFNEVHEDIIGKIQNLGIRTQK